MVKIMSWNVNGLRSLFKIMDLNEFLIKHKVDIFCLSEIKLSHPFDDTEKYIDLHIKGFNYKYWNVATSRKGYSGVCIWSKIEPISIKYGINEIDDEGRVIICEFNDYYLVNCYTPNSGAKLLRLEYRTEMWDVKFLKYMKKLKKNKNVIICGDLNVANNDIDIHNPKTNTKSAGFTIQERDNFKKLLKYFVDSFRYKYPDTIKYSYWSNFGKAREKNKGWRIDYFLVNPELIDDIKKTDIITDVYGSDHAPCILVLK